MFIYAFLPYWIPSSQLIIIPTKKGKVKDEITGDTNNLTWEAHESKEIKLPRPETDDDCNVFLNLFPSRLIVDALSLIPYPHSLQH